jgi:hypothetical protein
MVVFTESSVTSFGNPEVIQGNLRGYAFSPAGGFAGAQMTPVSVLDTLNQSANLTVGGAFNVFCNTTNLSGNTVRSSTSHSSGKYYIECQLVGAVGDDVAFGFCGAAQAMTNGALGDASQLSIGWYAVGGDVDYNNAVVTTYTTLTAGQWGGVALDLGARKIWFRLNNGAWGGGGDPALGTGGLLLSSVAPNLPSLLYFAITQLRQTGASAVNFGGLPYQFTAPVGFINW